MRYSIPLSFVFAASLSAVACGGDVETAKSPDNADASEHAAEHADHAAERAEEKADKAADKADQAADDAKQINDAK
jgi:hypothetical protein